ncbi:MAG: MauE/DoxX family redox-associated membrane protein [Candidatus Binatia bacterium]
MTAPAMDPAVRLMLRAALSVLFGWAAGHKLRDVTAFGEALADYDLLTERWCKLVARLFIAAELCVAGALWIAQCAAVAALGAAGLLAVYGGAIAVNLVRGRRDIDCGCTGAAGRQPLRAVLVVRNALLITAALASALPATARVLTWIDGVTVGFGVVMLVLLYAAADALLARPGIGSSLRDRVIESAEEPTGVVNA